MEASLILLVFPSEAPFTSTVAPIPSLLIAQTPVQPTPQLSHSPRDSPKEPGWDAASASAASLGWLRLSAGAVLHIYSSDHHCSWAPLCTQRMPKPTVF